MQRLILVSNRLPVTVEKRKGILNFKQSVGGLATGLSSLYQSYESIWVGWGGLSSNAVDSETRSKLEKDLKSKFSSFPIFLTKNDIRLFYSGFCNKTIWPLFHYFSEYAVYHHEQWASYVHVNKLFAQSVLKIAQEDDIIWVHDYHLMLLPQMIRDKLPNAQIGFFLHIPFPSYEVFRLLPWRKEILTGILGSDLIGFHTYDYVRHFTSSVRRILGYEPTFGQIPHNERITKVDAFPMGIDFERYKNADALTQWTQNFLDQCRLEGVCHVILSVDRLDYTKGIPQRLEAYDHFLEKYPEYKQKVTLILVAVPSRTGVEQYQKLKQEVDGLVGRINGKHSTIGWMPVWYFYRYMDFKHLTALYRIADVAMVTPLRDGMNLIAKEYLATREDNRGVLVLSEMAGAVSELAESIVVNPNNKDEISDALEQALTLPEDEKLSRNRVMRNRIKRYDITAWANDFIDRLTHTKKIQNEFGAKILSSDSYHQLMNSYRNAQKRLIFLDYDGTLVPFTPTPEAAKPDESLLQLLKNLTADPQNDTIIISGRDRKTLETWLGDLNVGMSAEHGVWVREKNADWHMLETIEDEWKKEIRPVLELFVDRTPGALIEEKSFSLVWHFRKADPEQGQERAMELKDMLFGMISNLNLVVTEGSKVIEVKNGGVNKGRASRFWTSRQDWDFILAIGDDWTDEDLFEAMPDEAFSIKVGMGHSKARYYLKSPGEVRELLRILGEN